MVFALVVPTYAQEQDVMKQTVEYLASQEPVTNMDDYMQRLSELEPDTTIPVKVLRNEDTLTFQVHLMPAKE